jgi:ubiquinone/menaquinone biosynthesis C-methylase UbiE
MATNESSVSRPLGDQQKSRMAQNLAHWEQSVAKHQSSHWASWGDRGAIHLEIENVRKHIVPGMSVLDAGCANGYTTFQMLSRSPHEIHAFDYSASMIAAARAEQPQCDPSGVVTFYNANMLDIPEEAGRFDLAYTVRVLINLPSWEVQKDAIKEMHRVLRPGGLYVLSEAFLGSQEKLNRLRQEAGLPPLTSPAHNLYLNEHALEEFLPSLFEIQAIEKFASLYYVASRFVRELSLRPGDPQGFDHPINEFFRDIPSTPCSGDFGIQKAYILQKPKSA